MAGGEAPAKGGDLGVRVVSALVMVTVTGVALWLGGWFWTLFVALVALGVMWEWWGLLVRMTFNTGPRLLGIVLGTAYIGTAAVVLVLLRLAPPVEQNRGGLVLLVLLPVLATDIGAYFAGRAIGGPKIAPKISPAKTWAGLAGGAIAAGLVLMLSASLSGRPTAVTHLPVYLLAGIIIAVIAQTGDFFESWMKRRAGAKDSGALIPGHGGLFDRVDGLIAVCFVIGVSALPVIAGSLASGGSLLPSPA
jgi:phosphatidate cytidylyltransferase